jgi:glycosyltransferase involved in cell wall biosynthesis
MSALSLPTVEMAAHPSETAANLDVSVVMPCLDESATIGQCISEALEAIKKLNLRGEVVVGDNGSTDGSQGIALELGARVISIEHRGYGAALLGAIDAARGQVILMGDSDGSHDFAQLDAFLSKLGEGYDLVVGNRFRGGIEPGAMPFLHRYVGNPVLSGIGGFLFRSPVRDFHCGLRALRREKIKQLHLQAPGMEFASEMIVKATVGGLRMAEIPTTQSPSGRKRGSNVRTWSDGWRHLRFLLQHSPQALRRKA